ncbi:MAG: restriction endonuclease [Anaerolineaceae bacterium]|nr:restriction endonuclease [Anaerolineaceae bacterium]
MNETLDPEYIRKTIIRELYAIHFDQTIRKNLNTIRNQENWDDDPVFFKVLDQMDRDERLIRTQTLMGGYKLTPKGIDHAEKLGIAQKDLLETNQTIRTCILDHLTDVYEDIDSKSELSVEEIASKLKREIHIVQANLFFLTGGYFVLQKRSGRYSINPKFIDHVKKWRIQNELINEFERLKNQKTNPQKRGREFQKLFARLAELHGWSQEESVKTKYEEIDVIIFKGREYYLIENKWEKESIQPSVVGVLESKLNDRAGIRGGILVSMSGYTSGAEKKVSNLSNKQLILLFGPNDVKALFKGESKLDELIDLK